MTVIPLSGRSPRPKPDAVSVVFDMGAWSVVFHRGGRFAFRRFYPNRGAAEAEADRLVRGEGMKRFRPAGPSGGDAA